jgi:uncharacterized protein YggT (Ycf19 family)
MAGPLLALLKVHLPVTSFYQLFIQASIIGLDGWMLWQYVIGAVLVLSIVSSYVYLGNAPFWNYINATAQQLLRPFQILPLRLGQVDLAPVLALALLVTVVIFAPAGLASLYKAFAA